MAIEFTLPNLGENIESVRVAGVLVSPGDTVTAEQVVLELETDKAMMDLPAPAGGTIKEVYVKEGQDVQVGQAILSIDEAGAAAAPAPPAAAASAPETADRTEDTQPPAADAEPAPSEPAASPAPAAPPAPDAEAAPSGTLVPASPSVRRFAREIGIEIADVSGSGPRGRVSVDDVKAHAKQVHTAPRPAAGGQAPALPGLPDFARWGTVKREAMSPVRVKTARQMHLCWSNIPHVTQFNQADITELEALRKKYAGRAEAMGGKLTMAVMVVKVVAQALKKFPKFNASIDMQSKEVIFKEYVNIGIAVNTPRGLLVPVLRDVDKKNMVEIAAEVVEIAGKARTGKVSMDDLSGGTFTVTNLGSIGGTYFTPIINFPEVSILGMGRAYLEADAAGSGPARVTLPLSLSYDHRLIDGAEGATFLKWVVDAIEQPLLLSLEG